MVELIVAMALALMLLGAVLAVASTTEGTVASSNAALTASRSQSQVLLSALSEISDASPLGACETSSGDVFTVALSSCSEVVQTGAAVVAASSPGPSTGLCWYSYPSQGTGLVPPDLRCLVAYSDGAVWAFDWPAQQGATYTSCDPSSCFGTGAPPPGSLPPEPAPGEGAAPASTTTTAAAATTTAPPAATTTTAVPDVTWDGSSAATLAGSVTGGTDAFTFYDKSGSELCFPTSYSGPAGTTTTTSVASSTSSTTAPAVTVPPSCLLDQPLSSIFKVGVHISESWQPRHGQQQESTSTYFATIGSAMLADQGSWQFPGGPPGLVNNPPPLPNPTTTTTSPAATTTTTTAPQGPLGPLACNVYGLASDTNYGPIVSYSSNGAANWETTPWPAYPGGVFIGPGGTLIVYYISAPGGYYPLMGLDQATGSTLWKDDTGTLKWPVEDPSGDIYAAMYSASDNSFVGLISISGSEPSPGSGYTNPIWQNSEGFASSNNYLGVGGGYLWDTNGSGELEAFNSSNGSQLTFSGGSTTVTLPSAYEWDGNVAVGPDGTAYVPSSNDPVIAEVTPTGGVTVVTLDQDLIFQGAYSNFVWAGGDLWGTYNAPGANSSDARVVSISTSGQVSPTISPDAVWGVAFGGTQYVLAEQDNGVNNSVDEIDPSTGAVHRFTTQGSGEIFDPAVGC